MSVCKTTEKFFIFIIILLIANVAAGQQRPHYTQYILNNYILNPAISGIENYTEIKIAARDQWVGLNGAPRTVYFSMHGPLGKKDYKTSSTSFQIPGENPRGQAYWETYTASEPHHGAGLMIINDKTGNFNRFTANASYAYHVGLNPVTNISAGFSAGISQIYRDNTKADFGGGDTYDPAQINEYDIRRLRPDLNAGVWLYSGKYFIGIAAQQIIPQKISFVDDATYGDKLVPHFFTTAGYRFLLNEDLNVIPSILMKYISNTPTNPQFDFNVKFQYQDLLWGGASYRLNDGYAMMAGLNMGNTFNIGYAYDITNTPVHTASRGTHEVILGFLINNRYGDTCPRNVW